MLVGVILAVGLMVAWMALNVVGAVRAYRRKEYIVLGLLLAMTLLIIAGTLYILLAPQPVTTIVFLVGLGVAVDMLTLLWGELNMGRRTEK